MNIKLIIARGKLWFAEDKFNCARKRVSDTKTLLDNYELQLDKARENYDKAYKTWWDAGVSKKVD
jgi:DNA repair ATPase RecN